MIGAMIPFLGSIAFIAVCCAPGISLEDLNKTKERGNHYV
jgi:hypothetical protein